MEKPSRIPALAVPGQADRKAGPGEAAWRGSNKPRPVCSGSDMPTSIWSFVVRISMEPFLLRKANDDRLPSIGASQARRQERRDLRLSIRMAKVSSEFEAGELTGAFPSDKALPRGSSRYEGKLSCPVPRGACAGNRSPLPGLRHEVAQTTAERGSSHDSALLFAAGILGEQALDGQRKLLSRVWSLPNNVAGLAASSWVQR
jgi:hypothetical protein